MGGVVAPYPEPLSSYGGQLTARTLAAGAPSAHYSPNTPNNEGTR